MISAVSLSVCLYYYFSQALVISNVRETHQGEPTAAPLTKLSGTPPVNQHAQIEFYATTDTTTIVVICTFASGWVTAGANVTRLVNTTGRSSNAHRQTSTWNTRRLRRKQSPAKTSLRGRQQPPPQASTSNLRGRHK